MPTLNSVGGPEVQCQNCSTRCISMKLYCLMLFGLTMTTVSGYRQSAMPFLRRDSHSVRQTYLAWPFKVRNAGPMMTASVQPDSVLQVWREAGMSQRQASTVWAKRPAGRLPTAERQQALVSWMQAHVLDGAEEPARLTFLTLSGAPRLLLRAGRRFPELQRSFEAVRAALGALSPKQLAYSVAHSPSLLLLPPESVHETQRWLRGTAGLSAFELLAVLGAAPELLLARLDDLQAVADLLRERLGIDGGRLRRIVNLAPSTLLTTVDAIEGKLHFLREELGCDEELVAKLVTRNAKLLISPVSVLRERTRWLERALGVSPSETASWLVTQPDFFSVSQRRCVMLLKWLVSKGVSDDEAAMMMREEPQIMTMSMDELDLRASFFFSVLNGTPKDLVQAPQALTCDLGRHMMLRHAYCLSHGVAASPAELLLKGNALFCETVAKCTEDELSAFEAEGKHLQFYQGSVL